MNQYNREQTEAICMVRRHLAELPESRRRWLQRRLNSYLRFRTEVAEFQKRHFADICTRRCFTSHTSACCSREGIITFFADVVVNGFVSTAEEIDRMLWALRRDRSGCKCVYLEEAGCLWRLKPIVCEMFLCRHARKSILDSSDLLRRQWERLLHRKQRYTWPSRPVLFDQLETLFIEAGFDSPLMYFHCSPGLLRIKAAARGGRSRTHFHPGR